MADIDIKALQVFVEIYATRSVSQAAVNLGVSQPTASFSLAKLRDHFHDQLFVRASMGMEPTPFAVQLNHDAVALLHAFDEVSRQRSSFDPALSRRAFKLAITDMSQIVLLPRLLNRLRTLAPGITLSIVPIDNETASLLEAGAVDLAVGFMPQLITGFYQQALMTQGYVGIVANDHPRLAEHPTLEGYLSEGHVIVSTSGTGHSIIERSLRPHGQRRVVLEVPGYLGLLSILQQTDLIATVPPKLAALAVDEGLRQFPLPFDIPLYQIKQHWHERNHRDPAHSWLRALMMELFFEAE